MNKQIITALVLSVAALGVTSSAKADIVYASASTSEFQSPDSYDFSGPGNFPPSSYQEIGTFNFLPITDTNVSSITISGSFGNLGYNSTTALSDYFLGDSIDGEQAVGVAQCDDPSLDCYSGQEGPYNWSLTLNAAEIASLSSGLQNGSIDFGYTWGQNSQPSPDFLGGGDANGYDLQYVEGGAATLTVYTTPEPATFLICFSGIAGVVILRRLRRV